MKAFLIALQFLTILPIKIKAEIKNEDYGASLVHFPLVGLIIGLLLAAILSLFSFLPHSVVVALVLIGSIIITGGMHLDGFADTCDGFYSGKFRRGIASSSATFGGETPRNDREKILEIMRDSRVGVMGVIGIVSILLLKYTLLESIPKETLWKAIIAMLVFGRWAQTLACLVSEYVRKSGKAKNFIQHAGLSEIVVGGLVTAALFLILLKLRGIIILISSLVPVLLFINYAKKKIGGVTGDTIGAVNESAEVSVLLFAFFIK